MPEWVFDVSQLNEYVRGVLASDPMLRQVRLRGEISNFKRHSSGHWYFTLKDARSRIACVMFRQNAQRMSIRPSDGMRVIVTGQVSLYAEGGSYQFYADAMRPDGVGSLYLQFEALKQKLMAEGLMDEGRKRPIPFFPRRIGIVTSPTGAVLQDIRRVAARRNPCVELVLFPAMVQGEEAAPQLAKAIQLAGQWKGIDTLIVGRGGGSMEDLWAFNEEEVARAIANCPIPVISAVGHETDFTIADFVADRRAATPSQAAEIAVPDQNEMIAGLQGLRQHLLAAARGCVDAQQAHLLRLLARARQVSPERMLDRRSALVNALRLRLENAAAAKASSLLPRLAMAQFRLDSALERSLEAHTEALRHCRNRLLAVNPQQVMNRGYAMVLSGHRMVTSRAAAEKLHQMTLCFADGQVPVMRKEE